MGPALQVASVDAGVFASASFAAGAEGDAE